MPHKSLLGLGESEAHPLQLMLRQLADGQPRSGAGLARDLGLTRAAVWKRIEALRQRGLPISGQVGRGYALPWALELLDIERIRAHLSAPAATQLGELHVLWEPQSTSSEVRTRSLPDSSFVLAESQLSGRGRRGRAWLSPPGLNIYLSCIKRFDAAMATLSGLSLAVGVMLMRALADVGVCDVGLKWPNDVLGSATSAAPGAKLAGVLVELEGEYGGPCSAVIGVGINLRMPTGVRSDVGQDVTDLAELQGGTPPPRNQLAAHVISRLLQGLRQFESEGFTTFAEDYARLDLLHEQPVRVITPQHAFTGVASGVDARGALCVRSGAELIYVDSAEVSVRPT